MGGVLGATACCGLSCPLLGVVVDVIAARGGVAVGVVSVVPGGLVTGRRGGVCDICGGFVRLLACFFSSPKARDEDSEFAFEGLGSRVCWRGVITKEWRPQHERQ